MDAGDGAHLTPCASVVAKLVKARIIDRRDAESVFK
jgi:hypothetical protein